MSKLKAEVDCEYFDFTRKGADLADIILDLQDSEDRLYECIKIESNKLAKDREDLFYNEVTSLDEISDTFNNQNKERYDLYIKLKEEQAKDWQNFLDWQDKYCCGRSRNYNEAFDKASKYHLELWHEQEENIQIIYSGLYDSLEKDRSLQEWNALRTLFVKVLKKDIAGHQNKIEFYLNKLNEVDSLKNKFLTKK